MMYEFAAGFQESCAKHDKRYQIYLKEEDKVNGERESF